MTLAAQLAGGMLAGWCAEYLADSRGWERLAEDVRAAVRGVDPIAPPPGRSAEQTEIVELAITQRVAFAIEPAPPYFALLGAHASDLVGVSHAHLAAGDFPTHTPLPMVVRIRRLDRRPTPIGWIDTASPVVWKTYDQELFGPITLASDPPAIWDHRHPRPEDAERAASEVLGLCQWLSYGLRFVARPGHLAAPTPDTDHPHVPVTKTALARACVTLATWEHAYRTHRPLRADPGSGGPPEEPTSGDSSAPRDAIRELEAILNRADPAIAADVEAMTRLAAHSGAFAALRALAGTASCRVPLGRDGPIPFGYARPVLVPHWADAAAVIGDAGTPNGTTLLTIAAPADLPGPDEVTGWCRQLLTLAWLDRQDIYRIGNLAIYLARHGRLVVWRVNDLAAALTGHDPADTAPLDALRGQFQDLAARAIASDGADPRWTYPLPPGLNAASATTRLHRHSLGR